MTRKRRKTRSRQERARIRQRTRQTFAQAVYRQVERHWASAPNSAGIWLRWLAKETADLTYGRDVLEPDDFLFR